MTGDVHFECVGMWHRDYGFHDLEWYNNRLAHNPDWDDVGFEPVFRMVKS